MPCKCSSQLSYIPVKALQRKCFFGYVPSRLKGRAAPDCINNEMLLSDVDEWIGPVMTFYI
jgi:hypothetical protein